MAWITEPAQTYHCRLDDHMRAQLKYHASFAIKCQFYFRAKLLEAEEMESKWAIDNEKWYCKLQEVNSSNPPNSRSLTTWTESDDDILTQMMASSDPFDDQYMAIIMGRTTPEITRRSARLDVRATSNRWRQVWTMRRARVDSAWADVCKCKILALYADSRFNMNVKKV